MLRLSRKVLQSSEASISWSKLLNQKWPIQETLQLGSSYPKISLSGVITSNFEDYEANKSSEFIQFHVATSPVIVDSNKAEQLAQNGISNTIHHKVVLKPNLRKQIEDKYRVNDHIGNIIQPGIPVNITGELISKPNKDYPFCYDFTILAREFTLPATCGVYLPYEFDTVDVSTVSEPEKQTASD